MTEITVREIKKEINNTIGKLYKSDSYPGYMGAEETEFEECTDNVISIIDPFFLSKYFGS